MVIGGQTVVFRVQALPFLYPSAFDVKSLFIRVSDREGLSGQDSACGYAGFTLMAEDAAVLTIEFKINLLAPAKGERFRMEGRVIKPGRTITVCEGRAFAIDGSQEKLVATMGCTLMAVTGRDAIQG